MEEKREGTLVCACCGCEVDDDDYYLVGDDVVCSSCYEDECGSCDRCGSYIYSENAITDSDHFLCQHCYDDYYTRCYDCDRIVHNDDSYYADGYDFCFNCYEKHSSAIREYGYKPIPILYGQGKRFLGVELEVDNGGHDNDNAEELLEIANQNEERIYIKSDGSLDDGFEIVTHPMTLDYHLNEFCWADILHRAVQMGYRSHQTSTCGLHVHVSRDGLGDSEIEQEDTISKILFFVEVHWNELLKFSRRTEYTMNRWAARRGYEHDPKKLYDKAKSDYNRYVAVNLCNHNTIEFRLFRGTLKLNTLLATLQLVEHMREPAQSSGHQVQAASGGGSASLVSRASFVEPICAIDCTKSTEDIFVHRHKVLVFGKSVLAHSRKPLVIRGFHFQSLVQLPAKYAQNVDSNQHFVSLMRQNLLSGENVHSSAQNPLTSPPVLDQITLM